MNAARQKAIQDNASGAPVLAYSSEFGGVYVHAIEYGINDSIVCTYPVLGRAKKHRARIYYATERPYIMVYGRRLHLDECVRSFSGQGLTE